MKFIRHAAEVVSEKKKTKPISPSFEFPMLDKALENYKSEALRVVQSLKLSRVNTQEKKDEITDPLSRHRLPKSLKSGTNFKPNTTKSCSELPK